MTLEMILDGTARSLKWCHLAVAGLSLFVTQVGGLFMPPAPQEAAPQTVKAAVDDTPTTSVLHLGDLVP